MRRSKVKRKKKTFSTCRERTLTQKDFLKRVAKTTTVVTGQNLVSAEGLPFFELNGHKQVYVDTRNNSSTLCGITVLCPCDENEKQGIYRFLLENFNAVFVDSDELGTYFEAYRPLPLTRNNADATAEILKELGDIGVENRAA